MSPRSDPGAEAWHAPLSASSVMASGSGLMAGARSWSRSWSTASLIAWRTGSRSSGCAVPSRPAGAPGPCGRRGSTRIGAWSRISRRPRRSRYLADAQATYRSVAQRVGCSWGTVWLWVGWLASLVTPAAALARVARLAPHGAVPALLPRTVAAAARAHSRRRADAVLRAYQVVVALSMLHRAQPEPPPDPSPLRWFLVDEFLAFRRLARLTQPGFSPAFDTARRGHPR